MLSWKSLSIGLLFLNLFLAAIAVRQPVLEPIVAAPSAPPPNIVFILTDDQTVGDLAYMPKVQELIGAQGVTFSNFFVTTPLCCPSRATILTGMYGHNTKILGNNPPNGGFIVFHRRGMEDQTIATRLDSAGYESAFIGKYLNGYPDTVAQNYIPPGWDLFTSPVDGRAASGYNYTLNVNGKIISRGSSPADFLTDVYSGYAIKFINKASRSQKPFFLFLAPHAPHKPAGAAPRDSALFANERAPRPPSYDESNVRDKPAYIKRLSRLPLKEIRSMDRLQQQRLRSLQSVDRLVERLVKRLKAKGELDNTFIIFSSDNGFHLGQHRLRAGKTTPYDEDLRVPLLIRGPGVPAGRVISQLGLNIDLVPTWLALANSSAPEVDGRSLVPLWSGDPLHFPWRNSFEIIFHTLPDVSNLNAYMQALLPDLLDPLAPGARTPAGKGRPPYRGLRTENYSFVEYATGEFELYDVVNDPYQLKNLVRSVPQTFLTALQERSQLLYRCAGETCRQVENLDVPALPGTTPTPTRTYTPSATPTLTATPTATQTASPTVTLTATPTATASPTMSSTPTTTTSPTATPTSSPTVTPTETPSTTASPAESLTPTPTASPTATQTWSDTPTPTASPTETQTPSLTPTLTATPTETQTPSPTVVPTATPTETLTPSLTPTLTGTLTPEATPTFTETPTETLDP